MSDPLANEIVRIYQREVERSARKHSASCKNPLDGRRDRPAPRDHPTRPRSAQ